MRKVFTTLLVCLLTGFTLAQSPIAPPADAIPNRLIVQLIPEVDLAKVAFTSSHTYKLLSQRANIYLTSFPDERSWLSAYRQLNLNPLVKAVQFDYTVKWRETPNDELFDRQPNLERAGFTSVWDENTGGTTPSGEEVVIAILDAGFDTEHIDLQESLWRNLAEVPNDGIDNDQNGYIDDLTGWNFRTNEGNFNTSQHGTQVIGMLGAKGDNNIGITGTGWNNKLMLFSIDDVSEIIAAYEYIIEQRQRWQNSNGVDGALVVATNASFGLEGRRCTEFPVWGAMYDELGRLGILTAASTANRSWDVDDFGDMPTTCPSEFLISVANIDENDLLWRSSGFGRISVDLAAPGQGSYTTIIGDNYGGFSNTSAAAPYVTGAIALLYSLPCTRLESLSKEDPAAAARLVRRAILQNTVSLPSLRNLVSTGGRLDVWAAWQDLSEVCLASNADALAIISAYPNPAREVINLEFADPALGPYTVEFIDPIGRVVNKTSLPVGSAFPTINTLPVAHLPRGYYVLRLSNERQTTVQSIILR